MRFIVKKSAFSYPSAYIFSDKAQYEGYCNNFNSGFSSVSVNQGAPVGYIGADYWDGCIRLDLLENVQDILFTCDMLASKKNRKVMDGYDVIIEAVISVNNNKIQLLGDVEEPSIVLCVDNGDYTVRVSTPLEEGRKGYYIDDYFYKFQIEIWPHKQ